MNVMCTQLMHTMRHLIPGEMCKNVLMNLSGVVVLQWRVRLRQAHVPVRECLAM